MAPRGSKKEIEINAFNKIDKPSLRLCKEFVVFYSTSISCNISLFLIADLHMPQEIVNFFSKYGNNLIFMKFSFGKLLQLNVFYYSNFVIICFISFVKYFFENKKKPNKIRKIFAKC